MGQHSLRRSFIGLLRMGFQRWKVRGLLDGAFLLFSLDRNSRRTAEEIPVHGRDV